MQTVSVHTQNNQRPPDSARSFSAQLVGASRGLMKLANGLRKRRVVCIRPNGPTRELWTSRPVPPKVEEALLAGPGRSLQARNRDPEADPITHLSVKAMTVNRQFASADGGCHH